LRIFVCEYVTGGGLMDHDLPPSLKREGEMMLTALVNDLTALEGTQVLSTRDPRMPPAAVDARFVRLEDAGAVWECWRRCMAEADAVWPIAPETGGALERLSAMAEDEGRLLLGSRPQAVRVAASKRATSEILARHGVPMVATAPAAGPWPHSKTGWVAKPDDGAGAEDTRVFTDAGELRTWLAQAERAGRFVVQPLVRGEPASLSALFRDGQAWLLTCNRQHVVVAEGGFRHLGGETGALEALRPIFAPIAAKVAAALPGLWGYAGIDLLMTADGPVVLEVNPRLTTSYVGLGAALGRNPAAMVLALAAGAAPSPATPRTAAPSPPAAPMDEAEVNG
jgi:predicted ATP-grasp superfamily ATP-dependent carboligase